MKKLLTVVVAIAMVLCLAFGLAACGGMTDNSGDNGGGSGSGSQTGEKLPEKNFEEAWANAFDEKNFENFKMTMKTKASHLDTLYQDGTGSIVRVGNLEHYEMTETVSQIKAEYYYDGEVFYNKNEAGEWEKVSEVNGMTSEAMLQEMVYAFANSAKDAKYSEEQGGYVVMTSMELPNHGPTIPVTNVLTFKDGKLETIRQTYTATGGMDYVLSFAFTYGGQTVELPEVKEPSEKPAKLMVWGAENQQDLLRKQVKAFKAANPEYSEVEFDFGICGDGNVYSQMSTDPQAGADVYAYTNDQLTNLLRIGALSPVSQQAVAQMRVTDYDLALESGKCGNNYYGYPYSDDGYFLYYDKSVVSESEATDLESIVAACQRAGKKFIFEFENSWYTLSMAFGAGATYQVSYDDDGYLVNVETTLGDPAPNSSHSYAALAGMKLSGLANSPSVIFNDGDAKITASLNDGSFGACIRGTWEAANIENGLAENYAATVLPKWKDIEGNTHDMATFASYKLWGVNAYSKNQELAHKFAAFLASEQQQKLRYEETGVDPTNLNARKMDSIKKDQAVQALYGSIENSSIPQTSFPQSYWESVGAFAWEMISSDLGGIGEIEERVKSLVMGLTYDNDPYPGGGGEDPDRDKNEDWYGTVYTLVGTGSGEALWESNWDNTAYIDGLVFQAAYAPDGVTEIHTLTIDLYEGDEFQIIHDYGWAGQMGFTFVADDAGGRLVARDGGGADPSISVAAGASGIYEITLTIDEDKNATIEFELKEAFEEVVSLRFFNTDGTTIQPSNFPYDRRENGRLYQRGAFVPAIPYTPGEVLPDPYLMVFDGWNKMDGTNWEGGTIDGDMTLIIRYKEEENPDFYPDREDAAYYLVGTSDAESSLLEGSTYVDALRFVRLDSYKRHNIYFLDDAVLHTNDRILIGWGNGNTSLFDWIVTGRIYNQEDEFAVIPVDGYYDIRINVDLDENGEVTGMEISIIRDGALHEGYYLIGTCIDQEWGDWATYADAWNAVWFEQIGYDPDIWTATITVTDYMVPSWSTNNSAEVKIKFYQRDGQGAEYGVGADGNGTAGDDRIILEEGYTYVITFNSETGVISWEIV